MRTWVHGSATTDAIGNNPAHAPGSVAAWDRYAYVENNPLRYTDPSGHKKRIFPMTSAGAVNGNRDPIPPSGDNFLKFLERGVYAGTISATAAWGGWNPISGELNPTKFHWFTIVLVTTRDAQWQIFVATRDNSDWWSGQGISGPSELFVKHKARELLGEFAGRLPISVYPPIANVSISRGLVGGKAFETKGLNAMTGPAWDVFVSPPSIIGGDVYWGLNKFGNINFDDPEVWGMDIGVGWGTPGMGSVGTNTTVIAKEGFFSEPNKIPASLFLLCTGLSQCGSMEIDK